MKTFRSLGASLHQRGDLLHGQAGIDLILRPQFAAMERVPILWQLRPAATSSQL